MEPQQDVSNAFRREPPAPVAARILLVDDEPGNLLALEALLGNLGQTLVSVRSGEEALRLLLRDDYAVILLDVQMAGLDGFQTARLLRGQERSRHTPIIFLTAFDPPGFSVAEAYKLGAIDYLVKPVHPEVLRAKVAGFVELFQKTERIRQMERAQAEQRLAQERQRWQLEHLRREATRKDEFLAFLGHELRNPLAPICQAAQTLRLLESADPRVCDARDIILRQTQHLTRLVDDLLDVARISRGKLQVRKERVQLGQVVARAVETSRPLLEARGHQLTVTVPAEPAWLEGDLIRLAQVVANLLNNAARYTEPGGRVWLSAAREGGLVVIRVRDTGVGIARDMLPRVFDLFTQVEVPSKNAQGGLGIGLTLVRQVVQLHGGTVEALSDGPGRGSEFVVRLAALAAPRGSPEEAAAIPAGAPGGRRVLVVDDNRDGADSLAVLLCLAGHKTRAAYNALDGLRAAREWRPDVVLLDIGLPDLTGHEVARRLRQELGLESVLLVALTGYGQDADRQRSRAAGIDHHLVKPVDLDQLQALLTCEPAPAPQA
jgi:signal transduction histidine kinase